jgi:hypothetical protein
MSRSTQWSTNVRNFGLLVTVLVTFASGVPLRRSSIAMHRIPYSGNDSVYPFASPDASPEGSTELSFAEASPIGIPLIPQIYHDKHITSPLVAGLTSPKTDDQHTGNLSLPSPHRGTIYPFTSPEAAAFASMSLESQEYASHSGTRSLPIEPDSSPEVGYMWPVSPTISPCE